MAEQWFTEYYKGVCDSVNIVSELQQDSLLLYGDTLEMLEKEIDTQLLTSQMKPTSVYTNANEAFCRMLANDNPDLQVIRSDVHSLDDLEGDYYILFGNRTGLFKQIDSAFYTIDLERVPIVSFFKKKKINIQSNKNCNIPSI